MLDAIRIEKSDITRLEVDAIVNAANSALCGGGGVDGAIHRAAGPELLEACRALGGCPTGRAVVTGGFRLPARWVIHAVGPVWDGGDRGEAELLRSAYRTSLELAREREARTVAFPAISCGAYRFPVVEAARIAVAEVAAFLRPPEPPETVILCAVDEAVESALRRALGGLRGESGGG